MYQKKCRLTVADKFFNPGGGPSIPQRDPNTEFPQIFQHENEQIQHFNSFINQDPIFSQSYPLAIQGINDVPGYQNSIQDLLNNMPGAGTYAGELSRFGNQLGRDTSQLSRINSQLGNIYNNTGIKETIRNQGALTTEGQRMADQAALAEASAAGMGNSGAGIADQLLNREQYRTQRYNTALAQAQGIFGQEAGNIGESAGITGQRAGLTQARQGVYSQDALTRLGLTQGEQGFTSQALQNANQTATAGVGAYTGLTNPILAYLSDLFSSNQNAAAAQSIAGSNKSSGAIGGVTSIIGSVAAAY